MRYSSLLPTPAGLLAQEKNGLSTIVGDVGVTQEGSSTIDPAPPLRILRDGEADMWGKADDFQMSALQVAGDAVITKDVSSPSIIKVPLEKAVPSFHYDPEPDPGHAHLAIHRDGPMTLQCRLADGLQAEDKVSASMIMDSSADRVPPQRVENHRRGDWKCSHTVRITNDQAQEKLYAGNRVSAPSCPGDCNHPLR